MFFFGGRGGVVYLYLVVNLSNELDFCWHFPYQIKNVKNKLMKQNDM
jgi:hypothetical protein